MTNPKWKLIVSRRVSVFRAFVMAEGSLEEMNKYLGATVNLLVATKNELSNVYFLFSDLKNISQAVILRIKENQNFPKQHVDDCLSQCQKLVEVSKSSGGIARNKQLTIAQVKKNFEKYYNVYKEFVKFVQIPVAIEQTITKNVVEFLAQKVGKEKTQDYLSKLMTPPKLPESSQEQIDLAKLAVKALQNQTTDHADLLNRHAEKYLWLGCYNIDEEPLQYSYFEERLMDLMKLGLSLLNSRLEKTKRQLAHDEEIYKHIIKELGVSGDLLGQIELLRQYVWLRTYRIEMQSKANFYIQNLFRKIADRYNRSLREITALSPKEILGLLSGELIPDTHSLESRIKSYVLLSENGMVQLYAGEEGQQIIKRELGEQRDDTVDQVQGTPAYRGKVQGVVRVLTKKEQISEFRDDEILVTTMTSPEFVPAILKARAIVTNEGGVLCHAAIVAREFKIPCIIGTGNATKVLKDGDLVEVDAEKGIVKILQKAK